MKSRFQLLIGGAVVALAAGLLLCLAAARDAADAGRRERQYREVRNQLDEAGQILSRWQSALRAYEGLTQAVPPSLSRLALVGATQAPPVIRRLEARPLTNGWVYVQAEAAFGDVDPRRVGAFIAQAETQRPPWRLLDARFDATAPEGGRVRAVLVLGAVGRPAPEPAP